VTAIVVANVLVAFTTHALADAPLFYEPFDYPDNSNLGGQNGGTGFSDPWGQGNTNIVKAPGMTWSDGVHPALPVAGNHALLTDSFALNNRTIARGVPGTSTWFSFIMQSSVGTGDSTFRFQDSLSERVFYFGRFSGSQSYRMALREVFYEGVSQGTTFVPISEKHFFVGRIDSGADADNFRVWVDPQLDGLTPTDASANYALLDQPHMDLQYVGLQASNIVYNGHNGTDVDEIRIGESYQSVTVPEPVGCGAIAALGLFLMRRPRRNSA
jgi:hypothetical protein